MNRLPQVLQNEIWEYVRGDRKFWKQEFSEVLTFFRGMKDRVQDVSWRGTAMTYQEYDSRNPTWANYTWTMDFLKGCKKWAVFREEFVDHHGWETGHLFLFVNVHAAMQCFVNGCTDDESESDGDENYFVTTVVE